MEREIKLEIEELEERISPGVCVTTPGALVSVPDGADGGIVVAGDTAAPIAGESFENPVDCQSVNS